MRTIAFASLGGALHAVRSVEPAHADCRIAYALGVASRGGALRAVRPVEPGHVARLAYRELSPMLIFLCVGMEDRGLGMALPMRHLGLRGKKKQKKNVPATPI